MAEIILPPEEETPQAPGIWREDVRKQLLDEGYSKGWPFYYGKDVEDD